MPTHARLLEPLIEDHFAARFGDAAADRVATTFAVGKVHMLAILFQVVQPRVVILLRTLQPHPTFLLGRTGDHFRHAVAVVSEHMPLLFGPALCANMRETTLSFFKVEGTESLHDRNGQRKSSKES